MSRKIFCVIFLILIIASMSASVSSAASPAASDITLESAVSLASSVANFTGSTADTVLAIARRLFIGLATLSLIMGLIRMLLTGESNIGTVFAHITKWVLYVGIFTWIMSSLDTATFIPKMIVNSFVKIGSTVGGTVELAPDDILSFGIRIYGIIVERGWNAGWGDFLGITFIGIIILVVVAMIAGYVAVAVVEMHMIICGGAVLLGFGGFEYTRDIALSYIKYSISVGMKLLMFTLVYALLTKLLPQWETAFTNSSDMSALITHAGEILGAVICMLMIVKIIPNAAQSIVNNTVLTFGHNSPLIGHSIFVEPRGANNSMSGSLITSIMGAFRGARAGAGASGDAGVPGTSTEYTVRTDEVLSGGSEFNPTNLRPQRAASNVGTQREHVSADTFAHYVPPVQPLTPVSRPERE